MADGSNKENARNMSRFNPCQIAPVFLSTFTEILVIYSKIRVTTTRPRICPCPRLLRSCCRSRQQQEQHSAHHFPRAGAMAVAHSVHPRRCAWEAAARPLESRTPAATHSGMRCACGRAAASRSHADRAAPRRRGGGRPSCWRCRGAMRSAPRRQTRAASVEAATAGVPRRPLRWAAASSRCHAPG